MADLMTDAPVDPAAGWVADHVRLYTQSNGAQGHIWREGVPTLLLTTRGRKSGQARRTALIYARDGDSYVVMASYGGSPTHPDWYLNIEADPEVVVQVGGDALPRPSDARHAGRPRAPVGAHDRGLAGLRRLRDKDQS